MEARYAASVRGSSPHRNASDVFGSVSGEVDADRNRRVFVMPKQVILTTYFLRLRYISSLLSRIVLKECTLVRLFKVIKKVQVGRCQSLLDLGPC
jgi:hypothetical protein